MEKNTPDKFESSDDDESPFSFLMELKPFVNKEVLRSFGYVLSEAVRRKKIKQNDVFLTSKPPWLKVGPKVDLNLLYGLYGIYSRRKLIDVSDEDGSWVRAEVSELYQRKPHTLFVEQCIWQALISALMHERSLEDQESRVLSDNLNYLIGYLHGIYGMNEHREKHVIRLAGDQSLLAVLERARRVKDSPGQQVVEEFFQWARERSVAGDRPSNIKEIEALPGFKSEWGKWPEKKKRQKYKEAGFTLKGGRPKKNNLARLQKT